MTHPQEIPDGISKEAWEAAFLPSEYVDAIDRRYHAAKAIMAATLAEREGCLEALRALHADSWGITEEQSALEAAITALQNRGAAIAAIRKRGEA